MLRILAFALLLAGGGAYAAESSPLPDGNAISKQQQTANSSYSPDTKDQAANAFPSIIKIIPTAPLQIEASEREEQRHGFSSAEWWLVWVTLALAVITGTLAWFTFGLWKDARDASNRQADEMKESIAQSIRSATAMEKVAEISKINSERMEQFWQKQMRAYLTVNVGGGVYQVRTKGLKFEVRPCLSNSGHTPAHNMDYWAAVDILPFPLPDTFDFPAPKSHQKRGVVLGPNQSIVMNAFVDNFVPDEDVQAIKIGNKVRLYIWGEVSYSDVFGEPHITKFCHSLFWYGEGRHEAVDGTYSERYNEAT